MSGDQEENPVVDQPAQEQIQADNQEEEKKEETKGPASGVNPMPKTQRACYELGQQLKEEGNNFFKQGNYAEAVKKYAKVRAFLRSMMPSEGGADNS